MSEHRDGTDAKESFVADARTWCPLLLGTLGEGGVVGAGESAGRSPWEGLEVGSARVIPASGPRAVRLRKELADAPGDVRHERYYLCPNGDGGEGGYVLLAADRQEAFRAGAELLPRRCLSWRLAKRALCWATRRGWTPPWPLWIGRDVQILTRGRPRPVDDSLSGRLAALSTGAPGPHRKLVARLLEHEDLPDRIVKFSCSEASREQVTREASALRWLSASTITMPLGPELWGYGEVGEVTYAVQEVLEGVPGSSRFSGAHTRFLQRLSHHSKLVPLRALDAWKEDFEKLRGLRHVTESDWYGTLLVLRDAIEDKCPGGLVRCTPSHGDFAPSNLMERGGGLQAFDWEYSSPSVPALHDLFHFVLQPGLLEQRGSAPALVERLVSVLEGPAAPLLDSLHISLDDCWTYMALYLFHTMIHDEALGSPGPRQGELRARRVGLVRLAIEGLRKVSTTTSGHVAV